MGQFQVHHVQTLTKPHYSYSSQSLHPVPITCFPHRIRPNLTLTFPHSLSTSQNHPKPLHLPLRTAVRSRIVCKSSGSEFDILSQPEERRRPHRRANGIFWILLINIGIYLADHIFQVRAVKMLYLYHSYPEWYQFLTATFCHANWNHLSSNLFFLYIFGKLVEEDEGNLALWLSYILTGVGANFVSWLALPTNAVSIGASGAVFGLFTISVLVKMSWDWRKILEVLILGQFVIDKVMEAAQASTGLAGRGGSSLMNVNHIAHLSGALVGVFLVWLLGRIPSEPPKQEGLDLKKK
ncbi:putative peptidase S54, rhomboid domain-containing protein [Rosa chinensis]|uniref:Putative peptidase S54, rhomboid domain-containing protein n=1 Tax=Rosa chinensis TaxID=74649 RepID=A0A2P6Q014_ROSCH|nr:rhomboid-like protein 11, chloroplastic [Rosa chinensis]PRQ27479.1 putative peptidase S54, rhomboid domain-containing protein [Rosa chinensis]